MTPVQARMARAALALTIDDLASRVSLDAGQLRRFERQPSGTGDAKLRSFLESEGIEFVGEDGIRAPSGRLGDAAIVPVDQLNSANDE